MSDGKAQKQLGRIWVSLEMVSALLEVVMVFVALLLGMSTLKAQRERNHETPADSAGAAYALPALLLRIKPRIVEGEWC